MNLYIIHIGKLNEDDTENKLYLIGPFDEYPTGLPVFNPGLVVDLKDPTAVVVAPGPILEKIKKRWPANFYGDGYQPTPFQPFPLLDTRVVQPGWKQTGTPGEIVLGDTGFKIVFDQNDFTFSARWNDRPIAELTDNRDGLNYMKIEVEKRYLDLRTVGLET